MIQRQGHCLDEQMLPMPGKHFVQNKGFQLKIVVASIHPGFQSPESLSRFLAKLIFMVVAHSVSQVTYGSEQSFGYLPKKGIL